MKKTLEQEYQELIEHWEKLHQVNQLTEAEILGDVVCLNNLIIKEIQKLMKKQTELERREVNIWKRLRELGIEEREKTRA